MGCVDDDGIRSLRLNQYRRGVPTTRPKGRTQRQGQGGPNERSGGAGELLERREPTRQVLQDRRPHLQPRSPVDGIQSRTVIRDVRQRTTSGRSLVGAAADPTGPEGGHARPSICSESRGYRDPFKHEGTEPTGISDGGSYSSSEMEPLAGAAIWPRRRGMMNDASTVGATTSEATSAESGEAVRRRTSARRRRG